MADPSEFSNWTDSNVFLDDELFEETDQVTTIFQCDKCEKTFQSVTNANKHVKFCNIRGFCCPECGLQFPRLTSAERHYEQHKGTDQWQCERCGKFYFVGDGKNYHKRAHRREFQYECSMCHAAFRDNFAKRRHEQKNHNVPRIQCNHCGKKFIDSTTLRKHSNWEHGKLNARNKETVQTNVFTPHPIHPLPVVNHQMYVLCNDQQGQSGNSEDFTGNFPSTSNGDDFQETWEEGEFTEVFQSSSNESLLCNHVGDDQYLIEAWEGEEDN